VPTWRKSSIRLLPVVGVAALLAGGIWWWAFRPRSRKLPQVPTATVTRETLPVTIQVNGEVRPERVINISPKTAGIVRELRVKEGDRVVRGQILAVMDDTNLRGQLLQAQGQVVAAQAHLQRLQAGNRPQEIAQAQAQVQEAQAALRQAELNLKRNQMLFTQGAISQQDLELSLTERDQALARLQQAKQVLDLRKSGFHPQEIAQARGQLQQAQGALKVIQSQLNDTILRAPFAGVVTRIYAEPGAFVTPTTSGSTVSSATSSSVLALAATNQVVAKVPESNLSQLRLGAEMLRIKSFLVVRRNATRDYLDTVALANVLGTHQSYLALRQLDEYYPQPNHQSVLQQLLRQLAQPLPFDLDSTDLSIYKQLIPYWQDWKNVERHCHELVRLFAKELGELEHD